MRLTRRAVIVGFAGAAALGCVDRSMEAADDAMLGQLALYRQLDETHRTQVAPGSEPGQRLIIMGRLIARATGRHLADHPIVFYHADRDGDYHETVPGQEATARLNGAVRTDSLGRFLVSTILPGDYGSSDDNRHVHTTVPGARPEGYDFFFRQYINFGLLRWARRSDQAVVLDLKVAGDILLAMADLPVKGDLRD